MIEGYLQRNTSIFCVNSSIMSEEQITAHKGAAAFETLERPLFGICNAFLDGIVDGSVRDFDRSWCTHGFSHVYSYVPTCWKLDCRIGMCICDNPKISASQLMGISVWRDRFRSGMFFQVMKTRWFHVLLQNRPFSNALYPSSDDAYFFDIIFSVVPVFVGAAFDRGAATVGIVMAAAATNVDRGWISISVWGYKV